MRGAPARNSEAVSRECGGEAAALLFFGEAEKKRRARAMHYHSGRGVLLGGKERREIESRRCAISVGAANALPLGGFCCLGNISHPAKRRRNTLWINSSRAISSHYLPHFNTRARPRETAKLFRANAAAKPPHCFFSAKPKKSGAHEHRTIIAAAAFCWVGKNDEKLKAAGAPFLSAQQTPCCLAAFAALAIFRTPRNAAGIHFS